MAEDFTAVINQLKQNNQAEAQRDSNLNQNIAFSRKDNKASLEKLSKAITGTTSAVKDADKKAQLPKASDEEDKKNERGRFKKFSSILRSVGGVVKGLGGHIKSLGKMLKIDFGFGAKMIGTLVKGSLMFGLFMLVLKFIQHPVFNDLMKFLDKHVLPHLTSFQVPPPST